MPDPITPEQQRENAARNYAASYDIEDTTPPEITEETPAPNLPPRRSDGTFKKPHPANLSALARDLGIPDEDVAELETPELDRIVKFTARNALRIQREASERQRTVLNSTDNHLGRQEAPPPVAAAPVEDDILAGADLDSFDPTIRRVMERVRDQEKTIKELHELREQVSGLKEFKEHFAARENQTKGEMIDDAFDALGETFASIFGKERVGKLTQEEYKRRLMILNQSSIDLSKPFSARQLAAAVKEAAEMAYGSFAAKPAPKEAEPEPYAEVTQERRKREWTENTVQKPTQRQPAAAPPGRQRAIQSVRRIIDAQNAVENNGMNGSAEPEDFLE